MAIPRCPGQDRRFWKPKDIFEVQCPYCNTVIEFWKDDPFRVCSDCGKEVKNPRLDLGCAKWCKYAKECLGMLPESSAMASPVIERLTARLEQQLNEQPSRMKHARSICELAETILASEGGDPCIVKVSALFTGILVTDSVSGTPFPENFPLHDLSFQKTLLEQSGIAPSLTEEICNIIHAILSGNKVVDIREFDIVWDAILIGELLLIDDNSPKSFALTANTFRTQSGKRLAERLIEGK